MIRRMPLAVPLILCLSIFLPQGAWPKGKKKAAGKATPAAGAPLSDPLKALEIPQVTERVVIDGVLNDAVWQGPPLQLGDWLTYSPLYGNKMAQRTQVWAAYDKTSLYFAFRCLDPEPDKIKSSVARRDTIWNDDWVGISLDALGSHQSSYDLFVNPNGIQGDILNSSTAGEDTSPDWVWDSAARRTEDGYTVEMRVPFKSIRFKSGAEVHMGILFWRRVSRLGMSASWPDLPPGKSIFTRHTPMLLRNVSRPLTLEFIPNVTYSRNQTRSAPAAWTNDSNPDGGITAKYGITSSVTLDGTYRPDFSQVESDAFQVEVNQRYPIFYSEKRPFFMEGMGTFDLAGVGGDGNMRTAVHTRRIVDPLFGVKLTGTEGKLTFVTLSAMDQAPGNVDASDPLYGQSKYFNIGRALYSLGKGTYIGGLVADTELADGHNRVVAGDISLRLGAHQQITATAIATGTRDPDGTNDRSGMAGQVYYFYDSKRQSFGSQFEHYDKDFQMDTAFYNRTGITTNWTYYSFSLYPDEKRHPWFKRFSPFVWVHTGRDRIQGGDEYFLLGGIRMYFTRQGFFRVDTGRGTEPWAGREFDTAQTRLMGGAQLYRWLNFYGQMNIARSIYYDPSNPFSGHEKDFHIDGTLQPNSKLSQAISYDRVIFDRASNGAHVYTVDIVNTKTTYQFDKHFSVRAIQQYDSSQKRVLLDYLGSFEFVPGTVAYAGYGALFERQEWDGAHFVPGRGDYLSTQRGFFFKVSYLYRF